MKTKLLIGLICVSFLSTGIYAQENTRVMVSPDKVTYKRTGKDVPDFKKSFTVTYPRISGILDPKARKTLGESLSYWKNFDTTLEENLGESHWLTSLAYRISYNKGYILGIELMMEGAGAYPDESVKNRVIDLRTGKRVYLKDGFADISGLLLKIDKKQKAEVKSAVAELKKSGESNAARELVRLVKNSGYSVSKFEEFSVSEAGAVFYYNYDFPHAAKTLEPSGKYFFSWADLRKHIRIGGLLEKFIS